MSTFLKELKFVVLLFCLSELLDLGAQSKPSHFRGLSISADNTVWVSGTKGLILRSQFPAVQRFDTLQTAFLKKDFRDIWALNSETAIAMSIADSAVVIKTVDAGKTWNTVYHNEQPGIFLDVIEIDPETGIGIILGDPMGTIGTNSSQKYFKSLFTMDYGTTWLEIPNGIWNLPVDTIESFFAASGTSLKIAYSHQNPQKHKYELVVGFAGGGYHPKFHWAQIVLTIDNGLLKWKTEEIDQLEMHMKGGSAWGCYGLAMGSGGNSIAVGGNYSKPDFRGDSTGSIASYSNGFFKKWKPCLTPPNGYRSGVCFAEGINADSIYKYFFERNVQAAFYNQILSGKLKKEVNKNDFKNYHSIALCTGSNGTDISFDKGKNWFQLQKGVGYNACQFSCNGVYFVGNKGAVKFATLAELGLLFRSN